MFCRNCGKEIKDNANFCAYCGYNFNEKSSNKIKVIFHRKKSFVACLYPIDVYIDKQVVGALNNDDSLEFEISYGEHNLLFSLAGGITEKNVNFSEDYSTCHVEVEAAMGMLTARIKILNIKFE